MSGTARCADCGSLWPLADLLLVTDLATGQQRFICRPSLAPRCFGTVKSRAAESIAPAQLVDRVH